MVSFHLLVNIGQFTGNLGIGAFAGGTLAGVVAVVSEYALPWLGFQGICGKPVATVSSQAFAMMTKCYVFSGCIFLAMMIALACIPTLPNPHEDSLND